MNVIGITKGHTTTGMALRDAFLLRKGDNITMVKINGEAAEAQGLSVEQYLAQAGYDAARVVVERNMKIVPKTAYAEIMLEDGDVVEILCFVGGG